MLLSVAAGTVADFEAAGGIPDDNSGATTFKNGALVNATISKLHPGVTFVFGNKTFSATISFDDTLAYSDEMKAWGRGGPGAQTLYEYADLEHEHPGDTFVFGNKTFSATISFDDTLAYSDEMKAWGRGGPGAQTLYAYADLEHEHPGDTFVFGNKTFSATISFDDTLAYSDEMKAWGRGGPGAQTLYAYADLEHELRRRQNVNVQRGANVWLWVGATLAACWAALAGIGATRVRRPKKTMIAIAVVVAMAAGVGSRSHSTFSSNRPTTQLH
jgi:hypothetical protein